MAVTRKLQEADRPNEAAVQPIDSVPGPGRLIPGDRSTAEALLKHVGTWVGDDVGERLREVYAIRGEAEFQTCCNCPRRFGPLPAAAGAVGG